MKKFIPLILFLFVCHFLDAQQVVATAGSSFTASAGSISFTIGECVAQTMTSTDKVLTQGFQQPLITVSAVSELKFLGFNISAYPNPVADELTLKIDRDNLHGLQFILSDMNGKVILQKNITEKVTAIPFNQLPSGFYILKIIDTVKELKTFKIVKE